ncbi:hypothetical protein RHMOL_Rhmol07G0144300 [Rhododendron molle]|uniref:Uncharacterized protein n=1 Tax=Rhododendron molle TaxID=49168 RepID=A0ACC0N1N1_RHOML|nr:hypothetical protein RHMOL_Rhmol07G0144300 [Rhododendron molle]
MRTEKNSSQTLSVYRPSEEQIEDSKFQIQNTQKRFVKGFFVIPPVLYATSGFIETDQTVPIILKLNLSVQCENKPMTKKRSHGVCTRLKVSQLKKICSRPDLVEVWDVTSAHPKLLVFLKSYRNSVPVPGHWRSHKRKYLQGKRGIEKQPFQLPDFIVATGIDKMREGYIQKQEKLKQKQREKMMHPKMGRTDMDYRVLHDAFFKYQKKPNLTACGDIYYQSKEFEVELTREMKPGMQLSQLLKEAIGMTQGGASPPWLISMQRHGPPPSYPNLKIPGVNAPIPPGASYGYHPGGWGKPPVSEYGDVFRVQQQYNQEEKLVGNAKHWGDLEEEEEEELVSEQTKEEEQTGGEESEANIQSVGVETPDVIDLRKRPRTEPDTSGTQDKTAAKGVDYLLQHRKSDGVDVTLQPEELEVMDDALPAKYEEAREEEEEKLRSLREDFSGMIAEYGNSTVLDQLSNVDCIIYAMESLFISICPYLVTLRT